MHENSEQKTVSTRNALTSKPKMIRSSKNYATILKPNTKLCWNCKVLSFELTKSLLKSVTGGNIFFLKPYRKENQYPPRYHAVWKSHMTSKRSSRLRACSSSLAIMYTETQLNRILGTFYPCKFLFFHEKVPRLPGKLSAEEVKKGI